MMNNLLSDLRYRRIPTALNAFSNANKCGLSSKRYSTEVGLSFDKIILSNTYGYNNVMYVFTFTLYLDYTCANFQTILLLQETVASLRL